MISFKGVKCPYCGKELNDSDLIAVCPECGTPHHRDCWMEHGRCFNEDKHAEGFEWKAPEQPVSVPAAEDDPAAQQTGDHVCPVCGDPFEEGQKFCKSCGARLDQPASGPYAQSGHTVRMQIPLDEKIDGVPIRDFLGYLGRASMGFILAFRRQAASGRKMDFNMGAMISPLLFFLYYRMWGWAAVTAVVTSALNLPSFLVTMASFGGVDLSPLGMELGQINKIANICSIVLFFLTVLCALYSTYLLRRHAGDKIKKLRRACDNEEDYAALLKKKACPAKVFYVILIIAVGSLLYALFL